MDISIDELKKRLEAIKGKKRGTAKKRLEDIEAVVKDIEAEPDTEEVPELGNPPVAPVESPEPVIETSTGFTPEADEVEPAIEMATVETPVEVVEEPAEPEVTEPVPLVYQDRADFNCMECKGEGMVFTPTYPEGKLCTVCHGTGKV